MIANRGMSQEIYGHCLSLANTPEAMRVGEAREMVDAKAALDALVLTRRQCTPGRSEEISLLAKPSDAQGNGQYQRAGNNRNRGPAGKVGRAHGHHQASRDGKPDEHASLHGPKDKPPPRYWPNRDAANI